MATEVTCEATQTTWLYPNLAYNGLPHIPEPELPPTSFLGGSYFVSFLGGLGRLGGLGGFSALVLGVFFRLRFSSLRSRGRLLALLLSPVPG